MAGVDVAGIHDRDDVVILVDPVRRQFAGDDPAEHAIGHPRLRCPWRRILARPTCIFATRRVGYSGRSGGLPMARVLAWLMAGLAVAAAGAAGVRAEDQPLRFLRFLADGEPHYGYLIDDTIVELEGDFLHTREETGRFVPLEAVELLPPVVPSKVIGVALNYPLDGAAPPAGPPGLFAKLPSSVVAHGAAIVAPPDSTDLHFEGEVVVVIGSRARNISPDQAAEVIFGVTAGNDVTERGYEPSPFNVLRIKAADTFAPLGPWVVPGLDYNALRIRTR